MDGAPLEGGTVKVPIQQPERALPWHKRVPSARRLILFSMFVFLMAVGTLVAGFAYIQVVPDMEATGGTWKTVQTWVEEPGKLAFEGKDRMNILVLGIDYNYTEKGILYTKGARSDTMFVISVDPKAQLLNILSMPRDMRVLISEEFGYDKINAAFSYGGVEQARETVSQFLGIPIHHYIIIKVSGASKMVDAIDGVPVDVEKDMEYDDTWGHLHIHLKKGHQILKGEEAVGYCRFRHDEEGDRGRIRRQQQVMRALVERLKEPSIIMKLDKIGAVVKENVETDMLLPQMLDLARLYKDFDKSRMRVGHVEGSDEMDGNSISYIEPDYAQKDQLVMSLLKMPANLDLKGVRVEVLNGSGVPGAGTDLVDSLRAQGFEIVRVATADSSDYDVTRVILYGQGRLRTHLSTVLPGADILVEPARAGGPEISVIIGKDRTLTQTPELPAPGYPTYHSGDSDSGYVPPHEPEAPTWEPTSEPQEPSENPPEAGSGPEATEPEPAGGPGPSETAEPPAEPPAEAPAPTPDAPAPPAAPEPAPTPADPVPDGPQGLKGGYRAEFLLPAGRC